jgi:uncharacterized protein (TIGR00369 family)
VTRTWQCVGRSWVGRQWVGREGEGRDACAAAGGTAVPPGTWHHATVAEGEDYGRFPLRDHLGMEVGGDAPGEGWATVTVGGEHFNPNGVVHGAVLFAMVDTAMGRAAMSVLEAGRFCASVEVQLRFIRPASGGTLRASVEVVKKGRAIVHLEGRVHDDADRLVATAAGTFAVIEIPTGPG